MRYLKYAVLSLLLMFLFFDSGPPAVEAQITGTDKVKLALLTRRAGDNRLTVFTDPYLWFDEGDNNSIVGATADSTVLDPLTGYHDRAWVLDVASITSISAQFDSVWFNISATGTGALESKADSFAILPKGSRHVAVDFLPGVDIWFEPSDSLSTGDLINLYYKRTHFVRADALGHIKVLTSF